MTTEPHAVLCGQCHRTVLVAVSDLHPPCFRNVEEQADCPEIQQRRGEGEGPLLLMMCAALARSLDEKLERLSVEAVDRGGVWQVACRVPGDIETCCSPSHARVQAEMWARCARAGLASRLRSAADEAERRASASRRRMRWPARILALSLVGVAAAAGTAWLLLTQSANIVMQPPAPEATETAPTAAPTGRMVAAWPPASQLAAAPVTAAPAPSAMQIATADEGGPASAAGPRGSAPITAQNMPPPETIDTVSTSRAVPPTSAAPSPEPAEPEMVTLPGGTFAMGSNLDPSEAPIHTVSIKPFAISKFPITVRAWNECVAAKACSYVPTGEDDAPVTNLSFDDVQQFIAWLAQATQTKLRLPSEAEWEYAARGSTRTKYWWGDDMRPGMADCKGCNGDHDSRQPTKAADLDPNPFGLYHMGGGVAQWVADCWHRNYQGAAVDGSPWVEAGCIAHVIRSGSWRNDPSYVRPASRDHYDGRIRYPGHGFRIARSL